MSSFVKAPHTGLMMGKRVVIDAEAPVKPRRYLVFAGSAYYPAGGWDDFKGSVDTVEDARIAAAATKAEWWHIIDIETGEEVESFES